MDNIMQPFRIAKYIFREESHDKRVIMGFVLGIALSAYWLYFFLRYAWDMGEPVNSLEPFIVIEHHYKNMLFLPLGWFLAISDAPFLKGNTCLLLYRSSRKKWNTGVLLYIALQSFCYVGWIAAVSVFASSFQGFFGNIWSSPAYQLAMDTSNQLGTEYNITFSWANVMKCMTVPQAFAVTFLFLWLYLTFLGVLLYTCTLLWTETYGILLLFATQLSGYLLQQDGLDRISLLAKSMPGYSIDASGSHWHTALLFMGIILFLSLLSLWAAKRTDFQHTTEET